MRTTLEIDDKLLRRAQVLTKAKTKKEVIHLELAAGTRTEAEHRELREDLEALQQFPITESVWRSAYGIAQTVRRAGVSVPSTDHLIAAVSFGYRCHILHRDKHFDLMARHIGLSVWTA